MLNFNNVAAHSALSASYMYDDEAPKELSIVASSLSHTSAVDGGDGGWCGTKPPGFHPPWPPHSIMQAINPQPLPPGVDSVRTSDGGDAPWCGTKPPGFHPPWPPHSIMEAVNPQPLPPETDNVRGPVAE